LEIEPADPLFGLAEGIMAGQARAKAGERAGSGFGGAPERRVGREREIMPHERHIGGLGGICRWESNFIGNEFG
jgi:hypothetical protein